MKLFKVFFRYVKQYKFAVFMAIAITVLLTFCRSLIPLFIGKVFAILDYETESTLPHVINQIFEGKSIVDQLLLVMLGILVTAFVRDVINVIKDYTVAYAAEGIGYNIQTDFYNHVQQLPYSYLNHAETGDLIQRSTSDINRVKRFIGNVLPMMLGSVASITVYSVQMLRIDLKLGGILICFIPVLLAISIIYFRKMGKHFNSMEETEGKLTTVVQENLTGIRVVKAFANEEEEIKKCQDSMNEYVGAWKKLMNRMSTYWGFCEGFSYTLLLVAFTLGVIYIANGTLALPQVISIFLYVEYIMWPTRALGRQIGEMSRTDIASNRILEIVDMETEFNDDTSTLTPEIKGNIRFENVSFQFNDSKFATIHDINLDIKQGETIALLGRTGSGKSTLVSMINRMLDCTEGKIYVDDIDITTINKKHLRKHVGMVLQEPFLFSRTIAENIGVILDKNDINTIRKVSEIAAVNSDIERFEKGYDTIVGERGVTLSGGQKQRISIARTLVENKAILIFDDSLSAVDSETDVKIRKALKERQSQSTTIIITHRVSTAMDADRIVILEDGTISDVGTYDELIHRDGLFKNIWEIQNSFESEGGAK